MTKVLIANRGEIACRIMRTCHEMGLKTVAVHSDIEADTVHTTMADEAYGIGPAAVRDSYLNIDAILDVARKTGAELVHPGYGLLSENPEFARKVTEAGLRWVGPAPDSMILMADKERSRSIAEECGVPIIKGSDRIIPDETTDFDGLSAEIGFPLLIKATAGGGGIGMRVCTKAKTLAKAAKSLSKMAERTFGDGTILLERYIERARHVEVQVFGIGDGRILTLFDRDCSAQRRFQKVIEEAPAPGLSDETRARMSEAARKLAASQSYRGAGTVEFIYDAENKKFFFLEMNTRLQVEHPVTEMITGIDLVKLQLQLAMEDDIESIADLKPECTGHAIECRIYAEDPANKFFPAPGIIQKFVTPEIGDDLRIDSGVETGSEITPYYDPLVAKVVAKGSDRSVALRKMIAALQSTRMEGLTTNIEFLPDFMQWPAFANAELSTKIIDDYISKNAV